MTMSALREAREETGVEALQPHPEYIDPASGLAPPLDIDSHAIPANPRKQEGAHWHHDYAYLLLADSRAPLSPQLAEVQAAAWQPVRAWAEGYLQAFTTHWDKTAQEFVVAGEWAFERYSYKSTDTPKAGGADVILLDEPTSALDPISTGKVEELIHELKNDYTVVIVTHNMQQAARVSDYTAFMYLGKMVEYGDTDTLFTNPKNKQTEDYITGRYG